MPRIRVLLADDHALVRRGFRALIEELDGIQVVAEASDGREAIELTRTHRPDVVLMDIAMPELNGIQAANRIKKWFPKVRVLLLSMHASEEYAYEAIAAGAEGYLLKAADVVELDLALRAVARGESYLSPAIAKHVMSTHLHSRSDKLVGSRLLTPRQREILQLIAESSSTKEIARKLELSVKTVETHRAQLMKRLDIHDVAGLVRYAIQIGLVALET